MAGRPRRRRASNSTVATVDDSQVRWAKESSILKPSPRGIPDNDWPCYVLTDATIYRKDGKTLANPLLVHVQGPLVIRGLLEVDDDELLPKLVKPNVKSAYIEISHSERYSIGDGPITLWISGLAGWFEIRPSLKYQPMYSQIREAITLYYGIFEAYEKYNKACGHKKKSKRPPPPTLDEIFLGCAVKAGDGMLRDEVEALCHKWADFLIPHFTKEVALVWDDTLFANWLRDSHPDVEKRIADAANESVPSPSLPGTQNPEENKAMQKRRSRSAKASSRSSEVRDVEMRDFAPDRSRSPQAKPANKGKSKLETPVLLPEKYKQLSQPASSKPSPAPGPRDSPADTPMADADSDSDSPVDRLLAVLREIAETTEIDKAQPPKIHSSVFFKCRIRHYGAAKEVISYYSKELLPRLGPEWKGTPFHDWLKATAKQPFEEPEHTTVEDIPAQTLRRAKIMSKAAPLNAAASQLPPAIALRTKTRNVAANESDGDSDEDVVARVRGRRSGKGAVLRLASSSKKRPAPDPDGQESGSRRGRKSTKIHHHISDDDEDEEEDTADDEVADDDDTASGSRLPLPEGAVLVVVHAERIPTMSPKGPNGTWTCEQEGCSYVVRSADEEAAQELIHKHFRDHEAQAEKINLALKESRGHMPINHLLDKIQAIGKTALLKKRETLNDEPIPAPIKRRLLI
ncbi:hypothetical protein MFIFM68171_05251 [Madurella fahalii]|uniref:Uncharacterized protein n=1 Tax=Madurella fahalii TaxID=1157608 RepID=A0ABQ0GBD4_9PEZI